MGVHVSLSANYLFALYPLAVIFYKEKIIVPHELILGVLVLFFLIFFVSAIIQLELSQYYVRKFLSFFIFMTMFSYFFISISSDQITAFKISIVLASLFMLAPPVYGFFSAGINSIGYEAKGLFGSQRYGYIYIMAFWVVYLSGPTRLFGILLLKYLVLLLIVAGILVTFSRSSVVSWFVSLIAYIIYESIFNKNSLISKIKFFMLFVFTFTLIFILVNSYAPFLIKFFNATFFSIFVDKGIDGFELSNSSGSEGYRLYMISEIIKFITINPFTGSGYLGVWVISDDLSGSAHNQYFDVLFRVGIFGFIFYILLVKRVVTYLFKYDKSLFFGFIGVLFYGLFHETFKLSQGGFLFAFLLALAFQKKHTRAQTTMSNIRN
jgi:hypothetical protein